MKKDMIWGKSDMCKGSRKRRQLGKVASILENKRKMIQRKSQFIKGLQTRKIIIYLEKEHIQNSGF